MEGSSDAMEDMGEIEGMKGIGGIKGTDGMLETDGMEGMEEIEGTDGMEEIKSKGGEEMRGIGGMGGRNGGGGGERIGRVVGLRDISSERHFLTFKAGELDSKRHTEINDLGRGGAGRVGMGGKNCCSTNSGVSTLSSTSPGIFKGFIDGGSASDRDG